MVKSEYNYTKTGCRDCSARFICNNFTKVVDCITELPDDEIVSKKVIHEVLNKGVNGDGVGISKKSISIEDLNMYNVSVD